MFLDSDEYIPLSAVNDRLPRKVSINTIYSWRDYGIQTVTGQVAKLECLKLGGRWITTVDAIDRFLEETQRRV